MNDGQAALDDPFSIEMPEPFRIAVTEFARMINVDAGALLAGARFEVDGAGFWVQHHGALDPEGMVLLVEVGRFEGDLIAEPMAALLTHNAAFPSALSGYFGMLPETKTLVHCLRIDLQAAGDQAAEAIASSVYNLSCNLKSAFRHVAEMAPAASGPPGESQSAFA